VSTPSPAPVPEVVDDNDTRVVESGDSFWSIASDLLTEQRGRPANEQEFVPYWRALVAANQSMLVNPSDPNLLFVGQVVELPVVG
jgi:nucleoid-associated protein YgaU